MGKSIRTEEKRITGKGETAEEREGLFGENHRIWTKATKYMM